MQMHQAVFSCTKGAWQDLPSTNEWNKKNVLVIAFCSPCVARKPDAIEDLSRKFPECTIVGCSTSGEIQGAAVLDNSICLTFVRFATSSFRLCQFPLAQPAQSKDVGVSIAKQLLGDDLKGVLIFSEGLNANGSEIVRGLNSVLTPAIPVGGGLAGDSTDFKSTFIISNGKILHNHAAAVGFYGRELNVSSGSKGGWDIFGPERTITRSQSNLLYEIDGKPALKLYKNYLGDKAKDLPSSGLLFPLAIHPPDDPSKKLVRTILNIDEKSDALIFAGDIPTGWAAQLMRANFDSVIDAAGEVYELLAKGKDNKRPELVVAVSCVGRRLVLGERCEEEVEALKISAPPLSCVTGFYSYGEISPLSAGKPCELHNQTMTLFVLDEEAA